MGGWLEISSALGEGSRIHGVLQLGAKVLQS